MVLVLVNDNNPGSMALFLIRPLEKIIFMDYEMHLNFI